MIRAIHSERNRLAELQEELEKELKHTVSGNLRVTTCKSCNQYYIDGLYQSKRNLKKAKKIAKRDYYIKLYPIINKTIKLLDSIIKIYESNELDSIYNNMCEGKRKLIDNSLYLTTEQYVSQFYAMEAKGPQNSYAIEGDTYTNKNEHVRSKSEKIIADELFRYDIPYRYEFPITLLDKGNMVMFYPDFTVLNKRTRKTYILEHLGMMDNIEYVQKTMRKLDIYEKNGFLLGKNLLFFRETKENPINVKSIKKYIEEYFL